MASGEVGAQDARPQGEHVGVVVEPGQAGRRLVVAQRGPGPADLVGGDGLALAAATEHDGAIGGAAHHGARRGGAEPG